MEKRLGKGLGALIPEKIATSDMAEKVDKIKISSIKPNKLQPRKKFNSEKLKELKDSIKEKGVIQPVIVRPNEDGYELIAGERRFRAVKELGYDEIPVIVKEVSDADSLELALIENIQREELNSIEEANAYMDLIEKFNFSQEEISKAVGKDKSTVSNTLRLLALPKLIQDYVSESLISMGHAKAILSLPTERSRIRFAKRIIKKNFSVRQAEELIRQKLQKPIRKTREKDEHLARIEEDLQHLLGTRVKVIQGKKRGRLEIFYYSNEDLDRILDLIRR
ncbi:MAG: ParB/RepB/Spo0J family partition protein [Candidatus Omnitrophota bacterium]|nr:MAG: ParB/RepB/Spo0J family partition protein [Candidatus Omnitrophota bacterium]